MNEAGAPPPAPDTQHDAGAIRDAPRGLRQGAACGAGDAVGVSAQMVKDWQDQGQMPKPLTTAAVAALADAEHYRAKKPFDTRRQSGWH